MCEGQRRCVVLWKGAVGVYERITGFRKGKLEGPHQGGSVTATDPYRGTGVTALPPSDIRAGVNRWS